MVGPNLSVFVGEVGLQSLPQEPKVHLTSRCRKTFSKVVIVSVVRAKYCGGGREVSIAGSGNRGGATVAALWLDWVAVWFQMYFHYRLPVTKYTIHEVDNNQSTN